MAEVGLDSRLLSSAATVSHLMGLGALLFIPVIFLLIFTSSFHVLSAYPGPSPTTYPPITYSTYVIVTVVAASASMSLNLLFGYFNAKIGRYYSVPALRRAGKAGIIVSILWLVLIPLGFGLQGFISFGPSFPQFVTILILWLPLIVVTLVVGLEYFIMMYRGLGEMRVKTHIEDFETAKTMWFLGLFIPIIMAVAMVLYGGALRKVAQQKQGVPAEPRIAQPPQLQVNYCTRCGARIEPGARFCIVCGSPIEYENE